MTYNNGHATEQIHRNLGYYSTVEAIPAAGRNLGLGIKIQQNLGAKCIFCWFLFTLGKRSFIW